MGNSRALSDSTVNTPAVSSACNCLSDGMKNFTIVALLIVVFPLLVLTLYFGNNYFATLQQQPVMGCGAYVRSADNASVPVNVTVNNFAVPQMVFGADPLVNGVFGTGVTYVANRDGATSSVPVFFTSVYNATDGIFYVQRIFTPAGGELVGNWRGNFSDLGTIVYNMIVTQPNASLLFAQQESSAHITDPSLNATASNPWGSIAIQTTQNNVPAGNTRVATAVLEGVNEPYRGGSGLQVSINERPVMNIASETGWMYVGSEYGGAPQAPAHFAGDIIARSLVPLSDAQLKDPNSIRDIVLDTSRRVIRQVRPVTYKYKCGVRGIRSDSDMRATNELITESYKRSGMEGSQSDSNSCAAMQKLRYGFIANELAEVDEKLVYRMPNGYMGVDMHQLIPIAVRMIQSWDRKFQEQAWESS